MRILSIIFILLFAFKGNTYAANEVIPTGSFIVNMGIVPQTTANGLKPYGLVYDLLKNYNVPVKWVIEPTKGKDGVDFTYNGVAYKGGTFIIPALYRNATVNARIAYWQGLGVSGVTTTTPITVPVYTTLFAPPNWTLDKDNGGIASDFFVNAGIPPTAHGGSDNKLWKLPAQLNCCDDLFVMPHADPEWATHSNLYNWNLTCRGGIWLGCHAGSALEDMFNPAIPTQQTNFLSEKIATATGGGPYAENALLLWGNHGDGTLPYSYDYHNDPIMQFMGTLDDATQNGSEQIYVPMAAGWRPTTKVGVYDPIHPDRVVPYSDPKHRAAVLAYGPGLGDPNRGKVMLEGSHNIEGTDAPNVAAQRAFFNFSLQTTNEKAVIPDISLIPSPMSSGTPTTLSYTIPAGSVGSPFTTLWISSCGGTFSPNNTQTVTFTPPIVTSPTNCLITVQLTDACNRRTFNVAQVVIVPDYMPVANFDRKITSENTPILNASVTSNDVLSLDGGNVFNNTCPLCTTTTNGTLTFNADGSYNYSPNQNFSGSDKFVYQICDADNDCDTAIVFITINDIDYSPTANADKITVSEDTPIVNASVTPNDVLSTDGGNTYNATCPLCTTTANGNLVFNADGSYTYTPNANFNGNDFFIYQICDIDGDCDTAIVNITITPINDVPIANPNTFITNEDTPIVTASVATNDLPSGDGGNTYNTTCPLCTTTANGTLVFNPNGTFSYTPNANFNGNDFFIYQICDANNDCDTAIVNITVSPVNDAPTANPDKITALEDTPLINASVTPNDVLSGDGGNVFNNTCPLCTTTANGTLTFNPNGTYNYTPNANFNGNDVFIYQICDLNNDCDTAIVDITVSPVNDVPLANPDKITASEDTPIVNASVTSNDVLSGDGGNVFNNTCPLCTTTANGMLTFNSNGTYNYTPNANFNGNDFFIYQICDVNNDCDTAIVNITVSPVNDVPIANPNTFTTNEDTQIVAASVANNDVPSGDGGNTYNNSCPLCTTTANGTLVFNANGTFTFTPNANYNGTDHFIYQICDVNNDCDTALVTITINPIDDAPTANADKITALEDTPIVNASVTPNDVLSGDGGNTFSNTCPLCTTTTNGTLTFNPNGTYNYTPNANFNGNDFFIYQICDVDGDCDTAIVNITVSPVNDVPIANADQTSTDLTTPLIGVSVSGNDLPSGDGGTTFNNTCPLCTTTANGTLVFYPNGTFDFTPNAGFVANDFFIYQICDVNNDCDTAIVYITNSTVDAFPSADEDKITVSEDMPIVNASVTGNDVLSTDGGNIFNNTCPLCTTTANGTLTFNPNGTYNYTPNPNFSGSDHFIYQICDVDNDCDTAIVHITITPVNDLPLANPDKITILEDVPLVNASVTPNDVLSGDGGNIFNNTCPLCTTTTNGTLTFNTNGTYNYTPNPNFNGNDFFIYQICDVNNDCDTAIVHITISPVNDVPTAEADILTVNEDTPLITSVATNDVLSGDGGNTYNNTCTLCSTTVNGTLTFNPDGSFIYTPVMDFTGVEKFIYEICDVNNDCDTAVVCITVAPIDDLPTAFPDKITTLEDTPIVNASVTSNDVLSGDGGNTFNIQCAVCTTTANGTLTFNPNGTYNYTPNPNFSGSDGFIYQICDADGDCDTAVVTITIPKVDDFPVAGSDHFVTNEDTPLLGVSVINNDMTVGDIPNTFDVACALCSNPTNGTLVFYPNGTFDYTPNPNFSGNDFFTYQICDADGDCDTAIVFIMVNPIDDTPLASPDKITVSEDTPIVAASVTPNDVLSGDGGNVFNNTCPLCTTTMNGTLTFNPNGTYNYTPNPNFSGSDHFIYQICDVDNDCDTAIVHITITPVNDVPLANPDKITILEDVPLVNASVTPNDVLSGDGGNIFNNTCPLCTATTNGTLTFNPNGTYNYTPNPNFNGNDFFIYQICDVNNDCDTAIVHITISPVNEVPTANNDIFTTLQNTPIVTASVTSNDMLSNDGGNIFSNTCPLCTTTTNGTLTFNPNGTFTYVPDQNFVGMDTFTYQLCDVDGDCVTATVTLTVTAMPCPVKSCGTISVRKL